MGQILPDPLKKWIAADQVAEGDVLCFEGPAGMVTVERITVAADGWIGLHANDDTFSTYYKPADRVRVKAPRPIEVDMAVHEAKVAGTYGSHNERAALILQIATSPDQWGYA